MKQGVVNWKSFQAKEAFELMGEVFTKPSLAIPGMALSMRDLLDRYVRGSNVEVFPGTYDEDDIFPPGVENLTEIERIDMARQAGNLVVTTRQKLQDKSDLRKAQADTEAQANAVARSEPPM